MSAETYTKEEVSDMLFVCFVAGGYVASDIENIITSRPDEVLVSVIEEAVETFREARKNGEGHALVADLFTKSILAWFEASRAERAALKAANNN